MIKEIVDWYGSVAFIFSSKEEWKRFVIDASKEMEFLKHDRIENLDYLLSDYYSTLNSENCCVIILKNLREYLFYCRNYPSWYNDWEHYKLIDWTKKNRKEKLYRLKNV